MSAMPEPASDWSRQECNGM